MPRKLTHYDVFKSQVTSRVIRELRIAHGMSQEQLSFQIGANRSYASMIEKGRRGCNSLETIRRTAYAFDMPTHKLVKIIEERIEAESELP